MLARGIVVSHETIRTWCAKFGPEYARVLRRRAPRTRRHMVSGRGVRQDRRHPALPMAVDRDGNVLDVLVQSRRNAEAAKRFFGKLMRKQARVPRVLVTDKLASYVVAHRELMPSVEHRRSKYLNNRAESSHQAARTGDEVLPLTRRWASSARIASSKYASSMQLGISLALALGG